MIPVYILAVIVVPIIIGICLTAVACLICWRIYLCANRPQQPMMMHPTRVNNQRVMGPPMMAPQMMGQPPIVSPQIMEQPIMSPRTTGPPVVSSQQ